jgi:lysine-specific demethylase/histidyl-hydroxylase NO66
VPNQSPLQRCVGDEREFLDTSWGRQPLVRRGKETGERFTDLLDLTDVDHLVTSSGLRTPAFRLVQDGAPLPSTGYTKSPTIGGASVTGLADPAQVLAAIDDGATLVLQGLHRFWEPLRLFVRGLESALGHTCQVNAYFTPPGAQGLKVHSDSHDVFVLQAFGSKRWEIHAPDEVWDLVLEPGDTLYMPKGTPHAATAQDTLSGHLTIGILTTSWREAITSVVRDVLADDAFDTRLAAGWHTDPTAARAELVAHLDDLRARLEKVDVDAALEQRAERFWTRRLPTLAGGLLDRTRLADLSDETLVRRRAGAMYRAQITPAGLRLFLGDRALTMPEWVAPAADQLASGDPVRVGDVPIDEQSRRVLVRRLVREGLLEVLE